MGQRCVEPVTGLALEPQLDLIGPASLPRPEHRRSTTCQYASARSQTWVECERRLSHNHETCCVLRGRIRVERARN